MHDCPDCGLACHCNGDIDDINFGDVEPNCRHCECPDCAKPKSLCDCEPFTYPDDEDD